MNIPFPRLYSPFVIPTSASPGFGAATPLYRHQTMNHDRGRGQCHGRGRGRGRLPTTFEDATVVTMFDHGVFESIQREGVAMEEAQIRKGHPRLSLSATYS